MSSETDYWREHRHRLLANGYEPLPIRAGSKRPALEQWSTADVTELVEARHRGPGVGLRTGHLAVIDIDVYDERIALQLHQWLEDYHPGALVRMGQFPKVALLYRSPHPRPKRTSATYSSGTNGSARQHRIEVLGAGQQLVAFHTHPDTREPYRWLPSDHWEGDTPLDVPLSDLPIITDEAIDSLFGLFDQLAGEEGWGVSEAASSGADRLPPDLDDDARYLATYRAKLGLPLEEAADALQATPMDSYHDWIRVGMALYHEYDGSSDALALWQAMSWPDAPCDSHWDSFGPPYHSPPVALADVVPNGAVPVEPMETPPDWRDDLIGWDDLALDEPPPEQIVQGLLVRGETSLISAQPNTGKSALAIDLALAVATGSTWRDKKTQRLGVLYIAAESPATVKARLKAIRLEYGIEQADIQIVQRPTNLSTEEGRLDFAKRLKLYVTALQHPLGMVILDTYRQATPGSDEKESKDISAVVNFLHHCATRLNAHLAIIHHTTKSGESYSGSGVFGAVVDTEIVLSEGEKEHEGLIYGYVKQQRSLATRGLDWWYKIQSIETGRIDNFGDPETAPVVVHLEAMDLEEVEAANREAQEQAREGELYTVFKAVEAGHGSLGALVQATPYGRSKAQELRSSLLEKGYIQTNGKAGKGAEWWSTEAGQAVFSDWKSVQKEGF